MQQAVIFNLDDLEVPSPSKKSAKISTSTTHIVITRRTGRKPSDGSHLFKQSNPSSTKPCAMADIVIGMILKLKILLEDIPQILYAKSTQTIHFGFENGLSIKLQTGLTEHSIVIEVVSR